MSRRGNGRVLHHAWLMDGCWTTYEPNLTKPPTTNYRPRVSQMLHAYKSPEEICKMKARNVT